MRCKFLSALYYVGECILPFPSYPAIFPCSTHLQISCVIFSSLPLSCFLAFLVIFQLLDDLPYFILGDAGLSVIWHLCSPCFSFHTSMKLFRNIFRSHLLVIGHFHPLWSMSLLYKLLGFYLFRETSPLSRFFSCISALLSVR